MTHQIKRLYRSQEETRLAGVCGGLGEYLGVDPVVVRLAWLVGTCVTGFVPGLVAYLLAWFIVPPEPLSPVPERSAARPHDSPA